jgi:hypothetical protein
MHRWVAVIWLSSASALVRAAPLAPADIDRELEHAWHKQHLHVGPLVDDAQFLRRVTIDLTGTIPAAETVRLLLADKSPDRRARAVDALLASPAYALHWASYWDRLLMGRTAHGNVVDRVAFARWLYLAFAKNRPWNEVVYELVSASGQNTLGGVKRNAQGPLQEPEPDPEGKVHPAVNWLLRYNGNPADLSGKLSRLFLGVQIQCAQCHDHPYEKWQQEDFRRLAACFARTRMEPLEDKARGVVRRVELRDEGKPNSNAPPRALDGSDFSAAANRRVALAEWLIKPDNPYFARAIVNRYWGHLIGRGLVDPVDDFRRSNPPVAPELLDRLAAEFVAHKYDFKWLIRTICLTRVYQLAVVAGQKGEWDERLFVHHRMRPLSSEELLAALETATGFASALGKAGLPNLDQVKQQIQGAFDFLFSVDEESPPPADFAGSIQQALLFLNGKLVNRAATALPGLALYGILDFPTDDAQKIQALYLRTLSRPPTPAETRRWVEAVNAPREVVPDGQRASAKQQAYEDLFWALLNSSEFMFQH